ncbi:uncharacterized protein LOC100882048 [Megachile rotundata]|uniref:uncharacterized protein LOC100882048 n=1 Tax=Megachile rotundata TaxID=143995 RepID=UPI003FD398A0
MMKFALALVAVMACVSPMQAYNVPRTGSGALADDVQDFVNLIPTDKIVTILFDYVANDKEVQNLVSYVHTPIFVQLVSEIEAMPEVQSLMNYMQSAGLDIYYLVNKVNKYLGLKQLTPTNTEMLRAAGGIRGMLDEIEALIPMEKVKALHQQKMASSKVWADFVAKLKSPEFQNVADKLCANATFKDLLHKAKKAQVNVEGVIVVIESGLGVKINCVQNQMKFALVALSAVVAFATVNCHHVPYAGNELSKDIHDFIDLIDMDKIITIISGYLDDDQVVEALKYMRSEEFHVLVRKVEALKAYQNLIIYLHDAGLDIYGLLQKVHKLFGMEDFVPPTGFRAYANRGGVKGMVDDVIAALPFDKFRALYKEKMQTSPAFKSFVEKLDSQEFQEIVDLIYKEPIFLEMRKKAMENGLDLDIARKIFEEIGIKLPRPSGKSYDGFALVQQRSKSTKMNPHIMIASVMATASVALIGFLAYKIGFRSNDPLNSPSLNDDSSLEEDFKDILAFVPFNEVKEIIEKYMKYDAQIGDTASFVNDQKRFIVREFQRMPQFNKLILSLREDGLDVDSWHEKVRSFWKTTPRFVRNDPGIAKGGLTVMINNILKSIPLDELHEFLLQKVKYSRSFRRFLQILKSKDFAEFCNAVENNDVLHHHYFWAKESGLEITFAIELFSELHEYFTQTLLLQV